MAYLLDANVLISAKNQHYGFDFCPGFWEWLELSNATGTTFSIEKVGDEIKAGDDSLAEWARARGTDFFLLPTPRLGDALRTVGTWATGGRYEPAAVTTFLRVADYYLVAQALADGHVVVTREVPSTSTKRIKIPDACLGVGVKTMQLHEVLRAERVRFVLGPTSG
ncbi:MAG: hypothetical protein AMXMBFR57_34630 [Acidimicrobiia bacterium]